MVNAAAGGEGPSVPPSQKQRHASVISLQSDVSRSSPNVSANGLRHHRNESLPAELDISSIGNHVSADNISVPGDRNSTITANGSVPQLRNDEPAREFVIDSSVTKSRIEKFNKLFPAVPTTETPINYYSCAFSSDILIQGTLWVSENFFCFYSKLQQAPLQIPVMNVTRVSKEKTAKFIPNAIGLSTCREKYVFASFLSRDSAHKLMQKIWLRHHPPEAGCDEEDEEGLSFRATDNSELEISDEVASNQIAPPVSPSMLTLTRPSAVVNSPQSLISSNTREGVSFQTDDKRVSMGLLAVLSVLLLSSALLHYRVAVLEGSILSSHSDLTSSGSFSTILSTQQFNSHLRDTVQKNTALLDQVSQSLLAVSKLAKDQLVLASRPAKEVKFPNEEMKYVHDEH